MHKAKWKVWLPIGLVVALAVGGYYYYKTHWQLPSPISNSDGWQQVINNNAASSQPTSDTVVAGNVDNIVAATAGEANAEQTSSSTNTGESVLVNSINQQVNDLSQFYDENQF